MCLLHTGVRETKYIWMENYIDLEAEQLTAQNWQKWKKYIPYMSPP